MQSVKKDGLIMVRLFPGEDIPAELEKVCKGGPEVLYVASGQSGNVELTEDARRYLSQRSIKCEILQTPQAVEAYNKSQNRKAVLIHVTC